MSVKKKIPARYSAKKPPKPIDESKMIEVWTREEWDKNLPPKGFITDLVTATRLVETPTKFAVWSALEVLSMIVMRDAWFRWAPDKLFLNLFVWLVAPPRICPKSTAVKIGEKAAKIMEMIISDPNLAARKTLNIVHSKATPEHLYDRMAPKSYPVGDGFIEVGSRMALVISELATFFGKQKYNEGLFSVLTNFYDCQDADDEGTRGRGVKPMKDMYVTMFGATTPTDLLETIPKTAFGSGFMSRLNIIHQAVGTRSYLQPSIPEGAPSIEELGQRLAWIAENAQGEYYLSPDAFDYYADWYPKFKAGLTEGSIGIGEARKDTNLLKIAALIQISQYERTKVVSLESIKSARVLIDDAVNGASELVSGAGKSGFYQFILKVKKFLESGQKTRRAVLREFQKDGMTVEMLNQLIQHLMQVSEITLLDPAGKKERTESREERDEIIRLKDTKENNDDV